MLMSRSSSSGWRKARQKFGVPDPTLGMSEPELAHLRFDKHCHICGCNVQQGPLFNVAVRCCETCEKENFVYFEDIMSLPDPLVDALPHHNAFDNLASELDDFDSDEDLTPAFRHIS
ncbi:hypothetical protein PM082_020027 [Marasmius tenuissimus]|nr:hypothetical protein PM082_020027 [Marasmius tenuissimus]